MIEQVVVVPSASDMQSLGMKLSATLQGGEIIIVTGPLGAGKTTLVQGMARGLGIMERVTSPSFALINIHQGRLCLLHCDFYRLQSTDDVEATGLYDLLSADSVAVIEWGEGFTSVLPDPTLWIEISPQHSGSRLVFLEAVQNLDIMGEGVNQP